MANIGTSIASWSTTEASNQPDTTDSATIVGDMRAIQAAVRYLYTQDTIASATTCDLGTKSAESLTISGTTTITGLGTVSAGIVKRVLFSGALTLTYHATSLLLPSNANIVTVAGDTAEFESLGSGNWRCNWYMRDSALPALAGANSDITSLTAVTALSTTGGVDIKGTNTNDSAAAGDVGEYVESIVTVGSAISLTSTVAANVTSISLTAGDWDVTGVTAFNPAGTTSITISRGSISTTSATIDTSPGRLAGHASEAQVPAGNASFYPLPVARLSLSTATTVYLVATSTFTVSTLSAYGIISARRVR
jgi:hypothetical protein